MSNVKMWVVVSNQADWRGGNAPYSVHDFEPDAIDAAKRQTDTSRLAHDIYQVELIGSTSIPQPKFHDRRPQSLPMPTTAGNTEAKS